MGSSINLEEIEKKVISIIAFSLGVDEKDVNKDSSLIYDLGAESLDFLDINFRLEKEFKIKLAKIDIITKGDEILGKGSLINKNTLTSLGIKILKDRLPTIAEKINEKTTPHNLSSLLTVGIWIKMVEEIQDSQGKSGEELLITFINNYK